jgi:N6-adenosine-specific RNA methylase IME4
MKARGTLAKCPAVAGQLGEALLPAMLPALPGVVFEPTRLHLPDDLPYERWLQIVRALLSMEGGVQWWLADCWAYGERKYGEGAEIAESIGRAYKTLRNYGSVGRAFELSRRRPNLSFAHHEVVAALPPEKADEWLAEAERDGLTRNMLRFQVMCSAAAERTRKVELDAKALGKFSVIYADPPWQYEHAAPGGYRNAIERQYPTMSLEEICALPVPDLCARHAALFLWVPAPLVFHVAPVTCAWGPFVYRTQIVWVKDSPAAIGNYVMPQHEVLTLSVRGEMPLPAPENRPPSVLFAPRREHSRKPDEAYELIERMYPGLPKVELFARTARPGWAAWGNQAPTSESPPAGDGLDIPGFLRRAAQ